MSAAPLPTGSITPIRPGSFTPISDTNRGPHHLETSGRCSRLGKALRDALDPGRLAVYYIPWMGHGGAEYNAILGPSLDALEAWVGRLSQQRRVYPLAATCGSRRLSARKILAARCHAVYLEARARNAARWSRHTRNSSGARDQDTRQVDSGKHDLTSNAT